MKIVQQELKEQSQRVDARQVLDELYAQGQLPFQLEAHKIERNGNQRCTVLFHDSRFHSVEVVCDSKRSFKEAFRDALLLALRNGREIPIAREWLAGK